MIALSHPTGNSFVRHALEAFESEGLLASFYTTVALPPFCGNFVPVFARSTFGRRCYPIPMDKIRSQPWGELARLMRLPGAPTIDEIYQSLDAGLARDIREGKILKTRPAEIVTSTGRAVYAYEDGALDTFQAARARGITTLYDLPIGYHTVAQKIFQEEALLKPEWAPTLTGLRDSKEKLERKARELSLADHVIVASSFTASTLKGLLKENQKLSVVSYGAPAPSARQGPGCPPPFAKLKVLYVGSLTQRKGISYLFDAITPLASHVELTVVGRMAACCSALARALRPHRYYASLPHGKILDLMRSHDVLVFPSLFEGFGLVLTEALSCGLPIIATANTAAPDLITEGVEGFIVPLRSSRAITEKLELMLSGKINLGDMRQAAVAKAQTLGWQNYEKSIISIVKTYVT